MNQNILLLQIQTDLDELIVLKKSGYYNEREDEYHKDRGRILTKLKKFINSRKKGLGLKIFCSRCGDGWIVGDKDRTSKEKSDWMCPNCLKLEKEAEADEIRCLESLEEEHRQGNR